MGNDGGAESEGNRDEDEEMMVLQCS